LPDKKPTIKVEASPYFDQECKPCHA